MRQVSAVRLHVSVVAKHCAHLGTDGLTVVERTRSARRAQKAYSATEADQARVLAWRALHRAS